jgi:Transposase DDE domain group 1
LSRENPGRGGGAVGTDCSLEQLEFQGLGSRRVEAGFDAGRATSDGGVLLLREAAQRTGLLRDFAECLRDYRNPERSRQ